MRKRTAFESWILATAMLLVFAACGGNASTSDSGETEGAVETTAESGESDPNETSPSSPTGDGGSQGPVPGAPSAGEALLEVDGKTIEGSIHTCEVSNSTLLMGARGELEGVQVEFGANGGGGPNSWIIQANVATESGDVLYNSSNTSEAEVSGQSFVITGEWVWNGEDGSLKGGQGVLSATCP